VRSQGQLPDTLAHGARSTVAEALKVLEWAGVLSWQNRITRILVRERDLFGQWAARWQVIRTSNAYVFRDPNRQLSGGFPYKSENPTGTQNQEILDLPLTPAKDPMTSLSTGGPELRCVGRDIRLALPSI
jgi:hypothetical protein